MSEPNPSGWSEDAADFVDAFRDDVDVDVDVDIAWAQFEDVVAPAGSGQRAPGTPTRWIGVAVAVAAALTLVWVVASATLLHGEASEPGQQAPDAAAPQSPRIVSTMPVTLEPASPQTEAVALEPAVAPPEAAAPRRPAATPSAGAPEAPRSAPTASRLAEELRLLDAMRAASKEGRHADALRMVREHAASFSSGSFAAERELTRVRALCGLGRHEQVRAAQSGFEKSHPASHLASLVRSACPGAAEEIQGSDHDG